uniref:WhiB family transcriptional regulator n=1 Tax=Streptomyces virginiae TaxID=1961 RepID=UPI002F9091EE
MSGNRTGVPQPPAIIAADDRIPFPDTDEALCCRTSPALFQIEDIPNTDDDPHAREKALTQAKHACSGCPIVKDCLKWELANPALTRTGVWAATTKRDRTQLRKQLVARFGLEELLADGIDEREERASLRYRIRVRLYRRTVRS